VTRRLPRVFSAREVQTLLDACKRRRDRLLVSLLYESGMRIGQALGLRHADIRSFDGEIDIVPRPNSNGACAKSRSPYTVHVSKALMMLYADYLTHEYQDVSHDYVFVNWWSGRIGAPMMYSTVIDLFRKLSSKTGLRATPHMFRQELNASSHAWRAVPADVSGILMAWGRAVAKHGNKMRRVRIGILSLQPSTLVVIPRCAKESVRQV
jgi:integrase